MRVRELYEGGNLRIGTARAQGIPTEQRDYFIKVIDDFLLALNTLFIERYNKPLWSDTTFKKKLFFAGSSHYFFKKETISNSELSRVKESLGDVDLMIDKDYQSELTDLLENITIGQTVGSARYMGYTQSGPRMLLTMWSFPNKENQINVQVDMELKDFINGVPSEWSVFSTSSSYSDFLSGIKGVFHKLLIQSIPAYDKTVFMLKDHRKLGSNYDMTVDTLYTFAIGAKQGGGLREKYKPVMDSSGKQQKYVEGLPVYERKRLVEYETDIEKIFHKIFDGIIGQDILSRNKQRLWSFIGLVNIIKDHMSRRHKEKIFEDFIKRCFPNNGKGLYANNPAKDKEEKLKAVTRISRELGVSLTPELNQRIQTFYRKYKIS